MKLQTIIVVFVVVMAYTITSYAVWNTNLSCDVIISSTTPKHLQINQETRIIFKKGVIALESETKTVNVKDSNAIDTILGCVVQSYDILTLDTDSFNFIKTKTINPNYIITFMYQPISETRIKEVYAINTKEESTQFYDKVRSSNDPVQYTHAQEKETVFTYLGETSSPFEFW